MKTRIEEGDLVNVLYVDGTILSAVVLNLPSQTGEMWIFKNTKWDELIYQNPMSTNLDKVVLVMKD